MNTPNISKKKPAFDKQAFIKAAKEVKRAIEKEKTLVSNG